MKNRQKNEWILWCENLGFTTLIFLSWGNELLDLPRHILGGATRMNWRESVIETILILVVWFPVRFFTRKLLQRLYYLESFPRICAWCRKVSFGPDWVSLEEFFAKGFNVKASHGICPNCKDKVMSDYTRPT